MSSRSLFFGMLVVALTFFGATAHAQEFGEESEESSESGSTETSEESGGTGESESSSSETGGSEGFSSGSSSSTSSTSATSSSGGGGGITGGSNALESGAMSLSFTVPGGGNPYASGAAGFWYMVADSVNLGINLGLGIEGQEVVTQFNTDNEESDSATGFDLFLAPTLRYYLFKDSSVAPYILGQIYFQKFFDDNDDTTADPEEAHDTQTDPDKDPKTYNADLQPRFGLVGGFGVEWFPIEQFSVGGHIGLGFDILRPDQYSGPATGNNTLTKNGARIGTLTSALTANIYF